MTGARGMLVSTLCLLVAATATAGDGLTVRLVQAARGRANIDAQLQDIAGILRDSLPYKSYRLIDTKTVKLPAANQTVALAENYALVVNGPQDDLDIRMTRAEKEVLETKVRLRAGKPLIVGGFPGAKGTRMLLVLTTR